MIKRFEEGKKGTMVMHKFLPLVMVIAISLCNQGHQLLWCLAVVKKIKRYGENEIVNQERASRLVPGFQPYDHPSQKVSICSMEKISRLMIVYICLKFTKGSWRTAQ